MRMVTIHQMVNHRPHEQSVGGDPAGPAPAARRRALARGDPGRGARRVRRSTGWAARAWTASPSGRPSNKRLIYYYFGNKDELFLAVLEDTYAASARPSAQLHLTDLPPAEAVRKLTEFTWNYYLEHPEFLTLLNSANLHRAGTWQRSQARARDELAAHRDARRHPGARARGGHVPRRRRPGAALHLDRRRWRTSTCRNSHTLSAIFGRNLMAPKARARAAVAHHRGDPRVCPEGERLTR